MREGEFGIEIKQDSYADDNIQISVTHNGYQWSSIVVTFDELALLRNDIDKFLDGQ